MRNKKPSWKTEFTLLSLSPRVNVKQKGLAALPGGGSVMFFPIIIPV